MKTEIETTETTVINSLQEIYNLAGNHQITAQELLNGRSYLEGKGWNAIRLSYELKSELCDILASKIGGRGDTVRNTRSTLMRQSAPQHWALERFVVAKYGDKEPRISYIAGQDQTWEMAAIRNYLKRI